MLNEAIGSVLNQTYPVNEIIVVDDGSEPQLKPPHLASIKLIRNEKNFGPAYARNLGAKSATGDLIAFLDADDFWHSEKIEKQIQFFNEVQSKTPNEAAKSAVLCGVKVQRETRCKNKIPIDYQSLKHFISGNWFFPGSTLLMRKDFFKKIGGFNPELRRLEDYEFFLRFKMMGGKILVVPEITCNVNRNPHAKLSDVLSACAFVFSKYCRTVVQNHLMRQMLGYFFLEIGAACFYSRRYFISALSLLVSFCLVPRCRIQLYNWWK